MKDCVICIKGPYCCGAGARGAAKDILNKISMSCQNYNVGVDVLWPK